MKLSEETQRKAKVKIEEVLKRTKRVRHANEFEFFLFHFDIHFASVSFSSSSGITNLNSVRNGILIQKWSLLIPKGMPIDILVI